MQPIYFLNFHSNVDFFKSFNKAFRCLNLMTAQPKLWGEKISLIIFQRRTGFGRNLALMPPRLVGAGFPFCRFTSISPILNSVITGWNKRKELIEEEEDGGENGLDVWVSKSCDCFFGSHGLSRSSAGEVQTRDTQGGQRNTPAKTSHTFTIHQSTPVWRQADSKFCPATQQCSGRCGAVVQHDSLTHFLTFPISSYYLEII